MRKLKYRKGMKIQLDAGQKKVTDSGILILASKSFL